jgi:hypothetical protein
MTPIATDLLQRHIETLVDDAACWETLIADDITWELAYAPSVGHPARLSGRDEVVRQFGSHWDGGRDLASRSTVGSFLSTTMQSGIPSSLPTRLHFIRCTMVRPSGSRLVRCS